MRSTRVTTRRPPSPRRRRRQTGIVLALLSLVALSVGARATASPSTGQDASGYARISGEGSSWAGNAVLRWDADVQAQGVTVDYLPDGSSAGRKDFATGLADFAVSEVSYRGDTADPQDTVQPPFSYSQFPVVAGGTAFTYNLPVRTGRSPALKLSQATLAEVLNGQITTWDDPAIAALNPRVDLPARPITVVVRADGAGSTALLTEWLVRQFPSAYAALCARTGCDPSVATSYFPYHGLSNFTAQSGSHGVVAYVASTPYSIGYDQFSYARGSGLPVVRVENAAGYFTTPRAGAVAVALTQAAVTSDPSSADHLRQNLGDVYEYGDPRTYPLSAYSSMFVPTQTEGYFDASKGATLGYFATHSLCEGQQHLESLGYSPLPMSLVLAGLDQVLGIPGVDTATRARIARIQAAVRAGTGNPCHTPSYQRGDDPSHNALADRAPFPDRCDAACRAPWEPHG